jgi:zinc protease
VLVTISLAGGPIEETPKNAGVSEVAAIAINEAATNRLTSTNIRDIMTGVNISVRAGAAGDVLQVSANGSPEDLDTGLQEIHALMTDGRIEESAFKNWKLQTLQFLDMVSKMPRFKATEAMLDLLSGGDPRLTLMTKGKVDAQTLAAAQRWFSRLCREAPIEVSVVGDISLDAALPLIEKYVGSLPKRVRTAEHLDKLRALPRSTGPLVKHVDVETVTPQAMAIAGFFGCEGRNVGDRRALDLASEILTSRLVKRIREELSIVYSIRARNQPSWRYADSGTFAAGAPCDPENVNRVVDEVDAVFKAFAEKGPIEEELANAKKQIANNLDTEMREPAYWSEVLAHLDLHHRDLNDEKQEKEAFERFTGDQLRAVFAKYYVPTRQFRVTAVPTLAPKTDVEKQPAAAP